MIKHIVAFRLISTSVEQKRRDAAVMKTELEGIAPLIDEVINIHVGTDPGLVDGHWDVVLVSDFATNANLETYQAHPEHVRASKNVGRFVAERAIVDYEFQPRS